MSLTQNPLTINKNLFAKKSFVILGSLCLVLAPMLSCIGWMLPHDSLSNFLNFNFVREATDATTSINRTNLQEVWRYYLLPHYFIYASMLFYAGAGVYLGYLTYRKLPGHALVGSIFMVVGAIYFVGVLGAFLSIPIGTIDKTNVLKISFALSALLFVGMLIFGFGMFKKKILTRKMATLFLLGNSIIIVFAGIENWMALGSLLIVVSLFPLVNLNRI